MGKKNKKDKKDKKSARQDDGATPSVTAEPGAEIARAEQRLAAALRKIDDARDELTAREQELMQLLERYGRIPAPAGQGARSDGADATADVPAQATAAEALAEEMGVAPPPVVASGGAGS